jgi:predicted transcriptional regulator
VLLPQVFSREKNIALTEQAEYAFYVQQRLSRRKNDRLDAELKRQGRKLQWLANQLGVSHHAIWRIRRGVSGAPMDFYSRAAAVLGVPERDIAPVPDIEVMSPDRQAAA